MEGPPKEYIKIRTCKRRMRYYQVSKATEQGRQIGLGKELLRKLRSEDLAECEEKKQQGYTNNQEQL